MWIMHCHTILNTFIPTYLVFAFVTTARYTTGCLCFTAKPSQREIKSHVIRFVLFGGSTCACKNSVYSHSHCSVYKRNFINTTILMLFCKQINCWWNGWLKWFERNGKKNVDVYFIVFLYLHVHVNETNFVFGKNKNAFQCFYFDIVNRFNCQLHGITIQPLSAAFYLTRKQQLINYHIKAFWKYHVWP